MNTIYNKLLGKKYHLKIYTANEELYNKYKLSTMSVKDTIHYDTDFNIYVTEEKILHVKKK